MPSSSTPRGEAENLADDEDTAAVADANDDPIMSASEEDAVATTFHAASLLAASLVDDAALKAAADDEGTGGGVKRDHGGNPVTAAHGHAHYYPHHFPGGGGAAAAAAAPAQQPYHPVPPHQQQHPSGWPQQQHPYSYPHQYHHHHQQGYRNDVVQHPYSYAQQQQKPPPPLHGYPHSAPLGHYPHHYAPQQHPYHHPHYPPPYPQHHQASAPAPRKSRAAPKNGSSPAAAQPSTTDVTESIAAAAANYNNNNRVMTTFHHDTNVPVLLCDADPRIPISTRILHSHANLTAGAFVRLEGLLTREDAYNVREPYDRCFEGYGGMVVGYDKALQRWNIKIEFRHARSNLPYHAILQCLPQNMYVEEPAPQRNPTDGSIILERNAGGFAVGDRHLILDCQERAERMQWNGHETYNEHTAAGSAASHHRGALNSQEEFVIRETLARINDCSRQIITFRNLDKVRDEVFHAAAMLGRHVCNWPRERVCGGTPQYPIRNGPYLCGFAAVFGPQRNRCLCEYCFCGYIGKNECSCNACYWALCSTMGWGQEIKDFDIPSVRSTVVYAARQVAMYPPFRLFESHYPGLSDDDSEFQQDKPPKANKDKKKEHKENNEEQKETAAKEDGDETSTKQPEIPTEQQRYQKEVVEKGIRWEAEVLPGVWRRYQPYLESRIEQLFHMGSPHYLYCPGNKAVEGTFLNQPDGHGRPPPRNVATRRILFHPHWREVEMHSGLCARVRRTGPAPQTAMNRDEASTTKADEKATTTKDDKASAQEGAHAEDAAAETGDAALMADTGITAETGTELADDTKQGTDSASTPGVDAKKQDGGDVEPSSTNQPNEAESEPQEVQDEEQPPEEQQDGDSGDDV